MVLKFVFLSSLDLNLYLFRLPVMQALVRYGHEVVALCPKGQYFDRFSGHGIKAIDCYIDRKSFNPVKELVSLSSIFLALQK